MRILTGTSGWSYPAWKGRFYPDDLRAAEMLRFYAHRLPAVEVNATFYRMPKAETLGGWRAQATPGFSFALKAPQRITHRQKLVDVAEPVGWFYRAAAELGAALGPVLFQLPPTLRKDLPRLRDLLALLPRGGRAALEFRHPSWHDAETLALLADAGVALCLAEDVEQAAPPPRIATAPFGYLRLRRPDYDDRSLGAWADWVRAQSWTEAFLFFKHEDEALGPRFALRMAELVGAGEAAERAGP